MAYYSKYIQEHHGWHYMGVYADEALTGTKDNRPEFKRLIDDCRFGKIDLVLTKSISRFARNTVDLLETVRELKGLGVDVLFEEQNIHTMSGDGELMLTILASYAQEESLSVSENCKWRVRKEFENGKPANLRFMYGYKIIKGTIQIRRKEAKIVRMVFEDYISGMGSGLIARKLNAMKVAPLRGGKWSDFMILELIKNEKYTGNCLLQKKYVKDHLTKKLVDNKGELPMYYAEDTHPAIIDKAIFDKAQKIREERKRKNSTKEGGKARFPLSSMITCGLCGAKYKRKVRNSGVFWQCTTYLREGKGKCRARQIPEETIYSLANEVLGILDFDSAIFNKHISEIIAEDFRQLRFLATDGSDSIKKWKPDSRMDSWTDEMRENAKAHAERRWKQWHQV